MLLFWQSNLHYHQGLAPHSSCFNDHQPHHAEQDKAAVSQCQPITAQAYSLQKTSLLPCSHRSLGRIGSKLELLSPSNTFIGAKGGDSQFEGIAYKPKTGTFLVVQESHEHGGACSDSAHTWWHPPWPQPM